MEERRKTTRRVVTQRIEYQPDSATMALSQTPTDPELESEAEARIAELRERSVRQAEADHDALERRRALTPVFRLVDLLFFLVYAGLGIRLVLTFLAASLEAPFARFIFGATEPLFAPFRGLLPNLTIEAGFTLALPVAFAILVYALAHAALRKLLGVFSAPRVRGSTGR